MHDLKNLKCLLPKTESLLLKMIDSCNFLDKYVLVGGSALALYLCHRKSEDLDFFTYAASMKVNVMFLRAKYRDYYDLYFLVKHGMSLKEVFNHSRDVVEGVTFKLFAIALVYIDDIEDDNIGYLEPIEHISKEKIRDFFQKKLNRL